jgi:hypothetical protein
VGWERGTRGRVRKAAYYCRRKSLSGAERYHSKLSGTCIS